MLKLNNIEFKETNKKNEFKNQIGNLINFYYQFLDNLNSEWRLKIKHALLHKQRKEKCKYFYFC